MTILTLYQAWMWLYLHILQLAPNFINNVDPVSIFWTLVKLVWMFWQPVMNVLLYPAPPPGLLGRLERGATPSPDLPLLTYPDLYTPWLVGINNGDHSHRG